MAITTMAGAIAGLSQPIIITKTSFVSNRTIGVPSSYWFMGSNPGTADTSTAGGVVLTSTSAGSPARVNALSGQTYLSHIRSTGAISGGGSAYLLDRLWHCGANSAGGALDPTKTTSQTINSTTWPARDTDGATSGKDVIIGIEVSTAMGAGTPVFTLTYTNSGGTGSRTANTVLATLTTAPVGSFFPIGLQAGDVGVQSVQSIQADVTWTSGQYILVAYRILAIIPLSNFVNAVDGLTGGFVQVSNNVAYNLLTIPSGVSATQIGALTISESQG